ncbi:MAG TPA: stealth conserved region 3 domain-containing protein, partial [Ruania sp.]|nr:stealth conserved region 3 domain-containing protein [Ruania sp.]
MRPGFDPTYVVEDHPTDPHETKYTVDAVGTEMLLYRDTASRRQRARDRVNTATSRALSTLPRSWYAALGRAIDRRQHLGRPARRHQAPEQQTVDPDTLSLEEMVAPTTAVDEVRRARTEIVDALRERGISAAVLPGAAGRRGAIVISHHDLPAAAATLAGELDRSWRMVPLADPLARPRRLSAARLRRAGRRRDGFRLVRRPVGATAGVELELEVWPEVHDEQGPGMLPSENEGTLVASRRQTWTTHLSAPTWRAAVDQGTVSVGGQPHLFDTVGEIDVVYTWVDGSDPEWNAQRLAALGVAEAPDSTNGATHAARFRSHDELRYSLRSVELFAPWVRRVHIVTAGQVPDWLDTDHPRLRLVDHRDIFTDPSVLPVFNSHAIESQLHHIPGLSERYLYLNDDVFLGRPVDPSLFFHGNGLAKFFMSSALMDAGDHRPDDTPVTSAAKNNRDLLARVFGRRVTHLFQHTPHPQLRSVLEEMEQAHPEIFEQVAASAFRHPGDVSISSALHHYYAYALGKAVPGRLDYLYLDLAHPRAAGRLRRLLRRREFDVFCLNDSPG